VSTAEDGATLRLWTCDPLDREVEKRLERIRGSEGISHVAVMPDVHVAGEFCIGTVVASADRVYPAAVGGDIGCGTAAMRFDCRVTDAIGDPRRAERILKALRRMVPVSRHSPLTMPPGLPDRLGEEPLSASSLETRRGRDGVAQLGTLGRGNHFLELQSDDEGVLWLMVHSGSRAMGQAIAGLHGKRCLQEAGGLRYLLADSPEGEAYLSDAAWARRYAHAGRMAMVEAASALLEELFDVVSEPETLIACDHNHVQVEEHGGERLWVHRKGALSARDGEPGIIPGSMGTESFHTTGKGCAEALRSSSHGAGRVWSRSEARRRISTRDLRRQMRGVWFDRRREARLRDEAPGAYRDVGTVMRAQKELTRIVRRVRPVLVHKG
jgi:tRNA-splicing ligase RtcB